MSPNHRHAKPVPREDIGQAIDPAAGPGAGGFQVGDELEEGVEAGRGEGGVVEVGSNDVAVGGVGFVPLEPAAGFCCRKVVC